MDGGFPAPDELSGGRRRERPFAFPVPVDFRPLIGKTGETVFVEVGRDEVWDERGRVPIRGPRP